MTDFSSSEAAFVVGEVSQAIEIPTSNPVKAIVGSAEGLIFMGAAELAVGKALGSNGEVTSLPDLVRELYTGLGWAALGLAVYSIGCAAIEKLRRS